MGDRTFIVSFISLDDFVIACAPIAPMLTPVMGINNVKRLSHAANKSYVKRQYSKKNHELLLERAIVYTVVHKVKRNVSTRGF